MKRWTVLGAAALLAAAHRPGRPGRTITGTPKDDVLVGTPGADTIRGLAGNDDITGGRGDDRLYGGEGNDNFHWANGDGHDLIRGGPDMATPATSSSTRGSACGCTSRPSTRRRPDRPRPAPR